MTGEPADGPRHSDGAGPDGEPAALRDFLSGHRMTRRTKREGPDAEQLSRRSVRPSTMSPLGLVRHLAEVERDRRDRISDGDPPPKLYGGRDAGLHGAVAEQAVADAAYKDRAPLRGLMVHRIEEYARHRGHADLLRERVDGRVGR
ncbi:mycothiol transferase [Streptomyces griseomycini]|nr:DUF664 domain-containing protein [Streptomyces griseomycini]